MQHLDPETFALAEVLMPSACGAKPRWASDEAVAAARFVSDEPPSITLHAVINVRSGAGAHTGHLVNGSERVMFDPARTWQLPSLPECNDVHFGMSDRMVLFYIDYHARQTFCVTERKLAVSAGTAEPALARAKAYGAVPKAMCSQSTSSILRDLPGFEELPPTCYPRQLSKGFADLAGVQTRKITDDDADNNHGVLRVQAGIAAP